tara:strand:+ start:380 stop:565 length:186 start_codon:yes stop_codon:yes gene_type:complete
MTNSTTLISGTTPLSDLDRVYFNAGYNYALSNIRYIIEGLELYNKSNKEIVATIYNLKEKK